MSNGSGNPEPDADGNYIARFGSLAATDHTPAGADIRKAARVPVECGGRTFVYDGTGALVSTDGVYEEGRGTPEDEAKEAAAAQAAWHNFNATAQQNIANQGLAIGTGYQTLYGLSGSSRSDWLTNQQAALTDQSAMLAALGQANVK